MAKILLLEDSETMLKIIGSVLNSKGHQVTFCKTPMDALENLRREKYDMIISDLVLPGGTSGFDFIKTVRNKPEFDLVPILVITGQRMEKKDVQRAIQVGGNAFIVKPFNPDLFADKVNEMLTTSLKSAKSVDFKILNTLGLWEADVKIVKLTDHGMEIKSQLLVPVDTKIKIRSACFKEIGIEAPWLKILTCKRSAGAEGYDITVKFVEVTEKELGPIKNWIQNSVKKAS